jgi:hypothetical protein
MKSPASNANGIPFGDGTLCTKALYMTMRLENFRGCGYLIVGAFLLISGAILMGLANYAYPPVLTLDSPKTIRKAFSQDKRRDAMFGSGIALLTTGGLMFFGFGATTLIASRLSGANRIR